MTKTKEKDWENHLVKQLQEWGWTELNTISRKNNHEVIDRDILGKQLQLINPELRTEQREKIIGGLVSIPFSYNGIIEGNFEFYQKLVKGEDYFDQNLQSYKKVYLISQELEKNDFSFVQQFKVWSPTNKEFVVFDLVLFINGIPLTIIEVKNWSDDNKNLQEKQQISLKQIKEYERTVPHIFNYLNFATASLSPSTFYYGVCGKDNQNYFLWKENTNNLLFTPQNFLDICQNFTLYNDEKEKFIIRYYQLETIRKINLEVSLAGVIQHATGSGKSFLMVCFINYLKNKKSNYCYLFVADRRNLVKQFYDNFKNFDSSARFNLVEEKSIIKGGGLFSIVSRKQADNSIFFTTIQKFNQERLKKLNCPNNFLVIIDEAHRSQHGEFAQIMRGFLPKATFLGLTATPLTKKGKSTTEAFGKKEYTFTSSQSVEEGFTVPLFYRLIADQAILANGSPLKEQYQKIIKENQGQEEEVKKVLNKEIKLETLISNPKRLDWITQKFFQICQTMKEQVHTKIFKVMFIAYSSQVVEELYQKMKKFSHHIVPIISPNKQLSEELNQIVASNEKNIEIFRSEKNESYQIALVLDMLNVGFDMPCLQAVFMDAPKSEDHNIFQTISRPNRQFIGKTHGTIIDFLGLKDNIIQAVKKYDAQSLLILDQEIETKTKESIRKLQKIYDNLGIGINIQLMKDLKTESNSLLFIADQLKKNEEQWSNFHQICAEIKKYQSFWKIVSEEVIEKKEKIFLQRSLEIAQLVRQVKQEKEIIELNFPSSSDLTMRMRSRLWKIIQVVPSLEKEEELWLIGGDSSKLSKIREEWTKEITLNQMREKLELLSSLLSKEDEFVLKLTNLLNEYNNKTGWEISELEIHKKELENEISRYKKDPEQILSVTIYRLLKENFPTEKILDLKLTAEKILKNTKELREKIDWNKRHEIWQEVRKRVWILCWKSFQNLDIVDKVLSALEEKEGEIQEFNHKYKELFPNQK